MAGVFLDAAVAEVAGLGNYFSVRGNNQHGREAFHVVFPGQCVVLLDNARLKFFTSRKVRFEQDEVFRKKLFKLRFPEGVFFHHDAEFAPVGTGEEHQDGFLLLFGGDL